jgi:hypothetical protein
MRSGGVLSADAVHGQTTKADFDFLATHPSSIGDHAMSVAFKVSNRNSDERIFDVEIDAHFLFGNSEKLNISDIGQGFLFADDLRDASTYWFDPKTNRQDNLWNNASERFFTGKPGIAFSWQQIPVPIGTFVVFSAIIRWGFYDATAPDLSIENTTIASHVGIGELFRFLDGSPMYVP